MITSGAGRLGGLIGCAVATPERTRRYAGCAAMALAVACGGVTAYSVYLGSVTHIRVAWSDNWEFMPFLGRFLDGALAVGAFFAPHNEHIFVFSRLVLLLDVLLSGGRNVVNAILTVAVQAAHAALIIGLIWHRTADRAVRWLAAACVVLTMFSIGQWENLVWGFNVHFPAVYLFASASAVLLATAQQRRGTVRGLWTAAGIVTGVAAAVTMSNGAFALGCIAAILVLGRGLEMPALLAGLAGIAAVGTYAMAMPSEAVLLNGMVGKIPALAGYLCAYLGAFFSALGLEIAMAAGLIGLVAAVVLLLTLWQRRPAPEPVNLALSATIWFVVASGAVTALGRMHLGADQALSSRYVTPSAVFWAALVGLVATNAAGRSRAPGRSLAALAAIAMFAIPGLFAASRANRDFRNVGWMTPMQLRQGADALLSDVDDEPTLKVLYADTRRMRDEYAPILKRHHLNMFAETRQQPLGSRVAEENIVPDGHGCAGDIRSVERPAGGFRLVGRSADQARGAPFDRIVLLSETRDVVGFGSSGGRVARMPAELKARWIGYVKGSGQNRVSAYGVMRDGRLCRIASTALR